MDDKEEDIDVPLAPLTESTAMSLLWEEMDVTREPPMERSAFDVSRPIRPIQTRMRNRPVVSVCPNYGTQTMRNEMHRVFYPFRDDYCGKDPVHIMFI